MTTRIPRVAGLIAIIFMAAHVWATAALSDRSRISAVTAMGISSPEGKILVTAYVFRSTLRVALRAFRRDRSMGHRVRILSAVLMITDRQTGNA